MPVRLASNWAWRLPRCHSIWPISAEWGLITGERESRFIHYSANFSTMDDLIAFLTNNCCQGNACLPKSTGCDTTEKRRAKVGKKS